LEYVSQAEAKALGNRAAACGDDGTGMTEKCAQEKRSLWPRKVYKEWEDDQKRSPKLQNYVGMSGWGDFLSCDEFPCEFKNIDQCWEILLIGYSSNISQWVCASQTSSGMHFQLLTTSPQSLTGWQ
jgi:hypothetical protein